MTSTTHTDGTGRAFTHRALFYEADSELVDALVPFVRDGVAAAEKVVVVVRPEVGALLARRLGTTEGYDLLDSEQLYTYPVHTLAQYVEAVRAGTEDGRRMRVAGEPVWVGRSETEIAEWSCVEAACNVVFDGAPLSMLCPYDVSRLDAAVVDAARRTHPEVQVGSDVSRSPRYGAHDHRRAVRGTALPSAPVHSEELVFAPAADDSAVTDFATQAAAGWGMADARLRDLAAATRDLVHIARALSVETAVVRLWTDDAALLCELDVAGSLDDPFTGLRPPDSADPGVDRLWQTAQTCDLVAVREIEGGTRIRLHFADFVVPARPGCGGIDELLGVYALGVCDDDERATVEEHLVTCAECRAEAERLEQVVDAMGDALPRDRLP